jgi:hypothetical protein
MRVREYTEHDLRALQAIHSAQGFEYTLPSSPRARTPYITTPETTMPNRKKPEENPKISLDIASYKLYYVNYEIGLT